MILLLVHSRKHIFHMLIIEKYKKATSYYSYSSKYGGWLKMVNAEKHKRIKIQAKFGMLTVENRKFMHKYCEKIINDANDNPQLLIDTLNSLNDELNDYYDSLASANIGSLFPVRHCERILEVYEHVFVIKNSIQYNYHMLRIDSNIIKAILRTCDRVLNEFMNLQELQNKNLNKKGYGGIYTVKLIDSDAEDYPMEIFENIIQLKEPIFI